MGAGSQRADLCESLLAAERVSHFTSSSAVPILQKREQEGGEGEREVPSDSALSFSLCFFTKNTELGLKLKQGKTRKRSAVCCSPSFSQFPV